MRTSPTLTAGMLLALLGALVLTLALGGCDAPDDQDCTLELDGWHCNCPDPAYTIADTTPWPCGHPKDGTCKPVEDCASDRECIGDDGTLVVIGQDTLTVYADTDGGQCVDVHQIARTK